MSSLARRIQQKGHKMGVHNDPKPVKRAPRGSRRGGGKGNARTNAHSAA